MTPQPGTCSVSVQNITQTSATASVNMVSGRNKVNWYINNNSAGTNDGPGASFSGLSPNTNYTVTATQWDDSPTNPNSSVNCTADSFRTGAPGQTGGGSTGGGNQRPPTPTTPPLSAVAHDVRIRLWNADGVTPYSGTDPVRLLINYRNGNRSYYANRFHNSLFYGFNGTASHNTTSVGVCDSQAWHPYYDPGYKLNADGTFGSCPAQNLDAIGASSSSCAPSDSSPSCTGGVVYDNYTCSRVATYDEDNNENGSYCLMSIDNRQEPGLSDQYCALNADGQGCHQIAPSVDHGCTAYLNGQAQGSCCGRQSWPDWGTCNFGGNDVCMGYGTVGAWNAFPRCFSPELEQPVTLNAQNTYFRINWEGSRNDLDPIEHTFTVAGPPNTKLELRRIIDGGYSPANSWNWFINPAAYPNRGSVVKCANCVQISGTGTNYASVDWFRVTGSEGVAAWDILIGESPASISGTVFVDYDGNGIKSGNDTSYSGARVYLYTPSTAANYTSFETTSASATNNYTFANQTPGRSYKISLDVPSGFRATTTNPNIINNLSGDQTVNFGISPIANAWFQTKDADLFSFGSLISRIPVQCQVDTGCDEYLSLVGSGGFPGVPFYNSATLPNFGYGSVSALGWIVNSAFSTANQNYSYYAGRMPSNAYQVTEGTITNSGYFSSNGTADPRGYRWFKREGDLTLDANFNLNNGKAVLFVNGNVTIKQKLTINGGGAGTGFFALIASGNINIDPGVTYQAQPAPRSNSRPALEGIFLANGQIKTGAEWPSNDSQLYVRGVLVGLGGVVLERNLDRAQTGTGNNTTPAEFVEYAPDIILNLPPELLRDNPIWEEVAP